MAPPASIAWPTRVAAAIAALGLATAPHALLAQDRQAPPGLEDLIFDLVPDDGSSPLREVVEEKFPTATFAVMELDVDDWADVTEGCARLVEIKRPRDLDPTLGPVLVD